eukprot:TRINITY_DN696_c0_g1_i13.p1 TRINITY_DN696_c0_g1~~TRINITY_DN696_c0_g1_i13.p1  ORF type:complete len:323 (-),score=-32.20 TRINITY_DN696_c0_g1_i13:373-1212(-)
MFASIQQNILRSQFCFSYLLLGFIFTTIYYLSRFIETILVIITFMTFKLFSVIFIIIYRNLLVRYVHILEDLQFILLIITLMTFQLLLTLFSLSIYKKLQLILLIITIMTFQLLWRYFHYSLIENCKVRIKWQYLYILLKICNFIFAICLVHIKWLCIILITVALRTFRHLQPQFDNQHFIHFTKDFTILNVLYISPFYTFYQTLPSQTLFSLFIQRNLLSSYKIVICIHLIENLQLHICNLLRSYKMVICIHITKDLSFLICNSQVHSFSFFELIWFS